MNIYLSGGTRIVTEDDTESNIKTLGDSFVCKAVVAASWGTREVNIELEKTNDTSGYVDGYKHYSNIIPNSENLFALDLSGVYLPVYIETKEKEIFTSNMYRVINVPETLCYTELYLDVTKGVYRRIGSRPNIIQRCFSQEVD
jgi:hypothetical protein